MLGMVRGTKAIFWLASTPQTGLAREQHAKADEGDDEATGQAQAGNGDPEQIQDGGSDEEADAQGGEQIEGGHVDLAANVLAGHALLNPSSRVAVVGGLTMGSRASKARKTTWKNIVDLGQMDGLG